MFRRPPSPTLASVVLALSAGAATACPPDPNPTPVYSWDEPLHCDGGQCWPVWGFQVESTVAGDPQQPFFLACIEGVRTHEDGSQEPYRICPGVDTGFAVQRYLTAIPGQEVTFCIRAVGLNGLVSTDCHEGGPERLCWPFTWEF